MPKYGDDLPEFLVRPRKNGKTTEIIEWVLAGERLPNSRYYSRMILTRTLQDLRYLEGRDLRLHGRIVTPLMLRDTHLPAAVEFALDDAEQFLFEEIRRYVPLGQFRLVSMCGSIALEQASLLRWVLDHLDDPQDIRDRLAQAESEAGDLLSPQQALPIDD